MKPSALVVGPPYPPLAIGETVVRALERGAGPLEAATLYAAAEETTALQEAQLVLLGPGPLDLQAMVAAALEDSPDLLLLYWGLDDTPRLSESVTLLRTLSFPGRILAFGPCARGIKASAKLLRSVKGLDGALMGDGEPALVALAKALTAGPLTAPPPGVSLRIKGRLLQGDLTSPAAALRGLPSPWQRALAPEPGGWGSLELGRPTWEDPHGPLRPFPKARIEADLDALLGADGAGDLLILPRVSVADPHLIRWLLMALKARPHSARIHLPVDALPGETLTQDLLDAGVRWLHLDPTLPEVDGPERHLGHPILMGRISRLKELGILTHLALPVGRPGWSLGEVEALLDLGLKAGTQAITLAPFAIPPDAPDASSARRRGTRHLNAPPYWTLSTRALSFEERLDALSWGRVLSALLPPYGATLRNLCRVLGRTAPDLLGELAEVYDELGMDESLEDRHEALIDAFGVILRDVGKMDALPALDDLAELETALEDGPAPPALPDVTPSGGRLDTIIPTLSPRATVLTFAHDVFALLAGAPADDTPATRTEVLIVTSHRGTQRAVPLHRLTRSAMEIVDGARHIGSLASALADLYQSQGYDYQALLDIYGDLISLGALLPSGTVEDPPEPNLRDNVLPFRPMKRG